MILEASSFLTFSFLVKGMLGSLLRIRNHEGKWVKILNRQFIKENTQMADRYIPKQSLLFLEIKTIIIFHFTLAHTNIIKKTKL